MAICYIKRRRNAFPLASVIKFLFILVFFNQLYQPVDALRRGHHKGKALGRQTSPSPANFFRQAPVCMDVLNEIPFEPALERFSWIFKYLHDFNTYIPVSDGKTSPSGMITRFELKAIKIEDTDSGYDAILRNWIHITIESAVNLEGLYVQAISSPWGIPFGEFITYFDCIDCDDPKTSFFEDRIHIVPCSSRAKLAYEHPTVFTIGGDKIIEEQGQQRVFFKRMHFNFRYTQYPGVDHTMAQFLIIAVRNFNGNLTRFETYFTPVYRLDVVDNPSGAFHVFYHGWRTEFIKCHKERLGNDWKVADEANPSVKLRYSPTFDKCLREKQNIIWHTCTPGPIQMDAKHVPANLAEWRALREGYVGKNSSGLDPDYGSNGQLCKDGGTWEWNVGKANWTIPELNIIITNETLYLNETSVDDSNATTCGSFGGIDDCQDKSETIVSKLNEKCGPNQDYHAVFCNNPPEPLYGKDPYTGDYILNGTCWDKMNLTQQIQILAIDWGTTFIFHLHGKLMMFAWTVGWNIVFFSARFMKEYSVIEKKSSYFGIGEWLWHHIIWTYLSITTMVIGLYLIGNQVHSDRNSTGRVIKGTQYNLNDLCNIHTTVDEVVGCLGSTGHRYLGGGACVMFLISYVSGWGRPTTPILRKFMIIYHYGFAYFSKFFFYVLMFEGTSSVTPIIRAKTFVFISLIDVVCFVMFGIATGINCFVDRKYIPKGEPRRKYCPVPEGIEILEMPSKMRLLLRLMLYVHIVLQLLFYCVAIFVFTRIEKRDESAHDCDSLVTTTTEIIDI